MEDVELIDEVEIEDSIKEERKWCVYIHTSPSGKKYVGITSQKPNQRWKQGKGYMKRNDDGSYAQSAMAHALTKYPDWNLWQHEIALENATEEEAKQLEVELIQFYKTRDADFGYNMTDGGEGTVGKNVSDETRQKISDALKGKMAGENNPNYGNHKLSGKNNPNYGKTTSEETKRKISIANTGRFVGEKSPRFGVAMSEETKQKLSNARIGKYTGEQNPNYGNHKIAGANHINANPVYCYELDMCFSYMGEGADYVHISRCCISDQIKGRQKYAGKHPETGEELHWKIITTEEYNQWMQKNKISKGE